MRRVHTWFLSRKPLSPSLVLCLCILLGGCAGFMQPLEKPDITLNAFRLVPSGSLAPEFLIDLHIVNPNATALALKGVAYSASIEGHRIISGASNTLPEVPAYGEADVQLRASADMLGGLRLFNDLLATQRDSLSFELSVKLDTGTFLPPIQIRETGKLSLKPARQ